MTRTAAPASGPSPLWHRVVRVAVGVLVAPGRRGEVLGDLVELWHIRRINQRRDLWKATLMDLFGLMAVTRRRFGGGRGMSQDITYAWRSWTRRPIAALATVCTLALGIGAATAIFTALYALLLQPLPFPSPGKLVHVVNGPIRISSFPLVSPSFVELPEIAEAGTWQGGGVNVETGSESLRVPAAVVDDGFFRTMGVAPSLGAFLSGSDGKTRVTVVSWGFWQRHLNGDRSAIGRPLTINGQAYTLTGVMPPGFAFPDRADLWLPPGLDYQATGSAYAPEVIARIAAGVTLAQAQLAVSAYEKARSSKSGRAAPTAEEAMTLDPLNHALTRTVRPTLVFLAVSVGLLLLVVCASLANVLLARVAARSHELLVRRSLGATSWRLTRQGLVESLLLTVIGSSAGLALAVGALRGLRVLAPAAIRGLDAMAIDARLFVILLAVSLVVAVLMSVAPCLAIASQVGAIVRAGRGESGAIVWRRFRGGLIAAQMAMALVLLIASAAALGALIDASRLNLGFGNARTVGAAVTLPLARFSAQPALVAYADAALARLRAAPGVKRAGATGALPGNSETSVGLSLTIPGKEQPPVFATYLAASPDYFGVMGIPVIAGRGINDSDRLGAPTALVLSESTARKIFGDVQTAVGAALNLRFGRDPVRCEVVGVVADVRMKGLETSTRSLQQMYVALAQQPPYGTLSFVAEIDGDHSAAAKVLTDTLATVDASVPVYDVQALDDVADRYLASHRTAGALVSGFAVITLVVAAIGLYGLVSQVVAERLREMGIRVALGANPQRLRTQFVLRAVALAGSGAIAGALAAAGGLSLIGSVVPGLAEVRPMVFAVNVAVLMATAGCAAWWPSSRINSIDPALVMSEPGI